MSNVIDTEAARGARPGQRHRYVAVSTAAVWGLLALARMLVAGERPPGFVTTGVGDAGTAGRVVVARLSTGEVLVGPSRTTPGLTVTVSRDDGSFVKIPWENVTRYSAEAASEHIEDQWRWKEGGGNVKLRTGKAYPVRSLRCQVLARGEPDPVRGELSAGFPITVTAPEGRRKLIVTPKQRGELGQSPADLAYVVSLDFSAEAVAAARAARSEEPSEQEAAAP